MSGPVRASAQGGRSRRRWVGPAVAGALAAATTLWAVATVRLDPRAPEDLAPWGDLDRGSVVGLRLSGPRGEATLARSGDGWRVTEPFDGPADPEAVEAVLGALEEMRVEVPVPEVDLGAAGLAPPLHRLELTTRDGALRTVELGRRSSFDGRVYARVDDGDAFATSDALSTQLDRDPRQLRDPRILSVGIPDVLALEVERPDGRGWRIDRHGSAWLLDSGTVDPDRVQELLRVLGGLRARAIVVHAATGAMVAERTGGEAPVVITVHGRSEIQVLSWYRRAQLVWGGEGAILGGVFPSTRLEVFDVAPEVLRDRVVLRFDPSAITRIELASGGGRATLRRALGQGQRWVLHEDGSETASAPARASEVLSLLYRAAHLVRGDARPPDAPEQLGLGDDAERLALWSSAGQRVAEIFLGGPSPSGRWARVVVGDGVAGTDETSPILEVEQRSESRLDLRLERYRGP